MWQHLLTRNSCLVDLNEKYLIFLKTLKILAIFYIADRVPLAISSYRPGSAWRPHFQISDQATEHLIFINIKNKHIELFSYLWSSHTMSQNWITYDSFHTQVD